MTARDIGISLCVLCMFVLGVNRCTTRAEEPAPKEESQKEKTEGYAVPVIIRTPEGILIITIQFVPNSELEETEPENKTLNPKEVS